MISGLEYLCLWKNLNSFAWVFFHTFKVLFNVTFLKLCKLYSEIVLALVTPIAGMEGKK